MNDNEEVNLIKLLNEIEENFGLEDFYAITIWLNAKEVSMQGYFTDTNLKIAKALNVNLEFKDGFLKGYNDNKLIKMVLSTNN
jgi:hypothetical protein